MAVKDTLVRPMYIVCILLVIYRDKAANCELYATPTTQPEDGIKPDTPSLSIIKCSSVIAIPEPQTALTALEVQGMRPGHRGLVPHGTLLCLVYQAQSPPWASLLDLLEGEREPC